MGRNTWSGVVVAGLFAPLVAVSGASAQVPAFGQAAIGGGQQIMMQGIAGGPMSLSNVDGSCRGYGPANPSHVIMVQPGTQMLRLAVSSGLDSTLMVQTPDGRIYCDDDGGGSLDAMVQAPVVPGPVRVWVGAYSSSRSGPYTLQVNAMGSGPVVAPSVGSVIDMTLGARPDPLIVSGSMGGPLQASSIGSSCSGYISPQPNHIVNARSGFPNLRFVVSGSGDPMLIVRYPDGRVLCNDDGGEGLNPIVEGPTGPGQIQVWVGSWSASGTGNPYQLAVTTNPTVTASNLGGSVAPTPQPGPSTSPVFSTVDMTPGARPDRVVVTGSFGGPMEARGVGASCTGWITAQPSHVVNARGMFPNLRLVVAAPSGDPMLVVRYPDGRIVCNDDGGEGLNPLVEGPTVPGPILVWVGSWSRGQAGSYQLAVTTNPGVTASNLGGGGGVIVTQPPPQQPPPQQPPPQQPPPQQPPIVTSRVDLLPRIPVTLIGPGMQLGSVAVWSPRRGPSVDIGLGALPGGGYRVTASIGGRPTATVDIPADVARDSVVTVTRRPDERLLVRAERAPSGSDIGQQMLMLIQMVNGQPVIAEQWSGTFSTRGPRWAR